MKSKQTTPTLPLPPKTWKAMPYGEHWSFAYAIGHREREDYDFRAEFDDTVDEHEEKAVIALLEAAPELLAFAAQIARLTQDGEVIGGREFIMENDDAVETLNELIESARDLTAKATGRRAEP